MEQMLPGSKKSHSMSYRYCTEWLRSLWFDSKLDSAGQEIFLPNEKAQKHMKAYGNAAASKSVDKIETPDKKSRAQIGAILTMEIQDGYEVSTTDLLLFMSSTHRIGKYNISVRSLGKICQI